MKEFVGWLNIYKPINIRSFEVVHKIKKKFKIVKIGHCGTLDPFAEGILVLCTGKRTKDIDHFMDYKKEYIATISLGDETDTLDRTGNVIKSKKSQDFTRARIEKIIAKYKGDIYQIPPYYSALKFHGIRLYKYARKGIYIRKKARKVHIEKITFLSLKKNELSIYVKCKKGTYIRSLARDIAYDLNTYGYLNKLSRIAVGPFNKENSLVLGELYEVS